MRELNYHERQELERAAGWAANRGFNGEKGEPLPELIGTRVHDYITANVDRFRALVAAAKHGRLETVLLVTIGGNDRAHWGVADVEGDTWDDFVVFARFKLRSEADDYRRAYLTDDREWLAELDDRAVNLDHVYFPDARIQQVVPQFKGAPLAEDGAA